MWSYIETQTGHRHLSEILHDPLYCYLVLFSRINKKSTHNANYICNVSLIHTMVYIKLPTTKTYGTTFIASSLFSWEILPWTQSKMVCERRTNCLRLMHAISFQYVLNVAFLWYHRHIVFRLREIFVPKICLVSPKPSYQNTYWAPSSTSQCRTCLAEQSTYLSI